MRVAIVGGGIMGLSAAWALARRRHRVTLFEQGPIPNPLGSSVDDHRLIRFPYGDREGYARMVRQAYAAWRLMWSDLGRRLEVPTGTLLLAKPDDGPWLDESLAVLQRIGIPYEPLDPTALARRFPLLGFADVVRGVRLESGGLLLAAEIVAALARHLPGLGVALHPNRAVAEIEPETAALRLADGTRVAADALVVAAGPWTARLLPDMASRARPSRQVCLYFAPPADLLEGWRRMPIMLSAGAQRGFYLAPPAAGTPLKIGDHRFTLAGDPDADRTATLAEIEPVLAAMRPRLRDFERFRFLRGRACFYSVAPEERFVLERRGRAWLLAGFSGHGFKFGALMGIAVARGIDGERDAATLARWAAGEVG